MERHISNNTIDLFFKPPTSLGRKVAVSFLEYLLYARYQIPFYFDLFEKLIEKKRREMIENDSRRLDWKTENQVKLAYETYEKVNQMKKVFKSFINNKDDKLVNKKCPFSFSR